MFFGVEKMADQGHRDHVNALFVQNSPRIRGFIISLVSNMALADDVLQETFVTASAKADEFTPGSNFVAWACRIAQFKVLEESRRMRRTNGILSPEVIEAVCSTISIEPEDQTEERLEALKWCLNRLAPHTRQAFELRYTHAHKTSEIAKILGWSVESASVILSRGRSALKKCITSRMELNSHGF